LCPATPQGQGQGQPFAAINPRARLLPSPRSRPVFVLQKRKPDPNGRPTAPPPPPLQRACAQGHAVASPRGATGLGGPGPGFCPGRRRFPRQLPLWSCTKKESKNKDALSVVQRRLTKAHYLLVQIVSTASCDAQRPLVLWGAEATGSIWISGAGPPPCLRYYHTRR
jgi:hypothetical protein